MKSKTVNHYIEQHPEWDTILKQLRSILKETELEETIKWGAPAYTINNKNVVGMGAFKSYAGLWFFNGALLKDEARVLINAQEGKTVAMRQWRFNTESEIDAKLIKAYLLEAIQNQKEGREVIIPKKKKTVSAELLTKMLPKDKELKKAFLLFTEAKQREFHEYILEAKRDATKQKRLEKIIPLIKKGEGLYDKYKKR
ncbi:DUF1801 domain-containing protein [Galbibacter sp. EGI 63066]|uniref:YdeI/OmpD-associated family protein n=1 Tax=Galbibacter sp. EGI 63066 TaxID=2993559 RepID=UPI0022494D4E|nr:DUF1801 domain-containing protein [Galbibacter sp. EGI 63066]MCX2679604.1 DUF1801 domain-containing protein [Galbibacter sp. EGI 63066]